MDHNPEVLKRERLFGGRLSDAKTVAAILFWDRFRRETA
jgi:hypothetical protein